MRLDEFIEGYERDEAADLRKLAEEKSYAITEYIEGVETGFAESVQGDSLFGSTAPSIFVGRSGYPEVATGLLSPVAGEFDPTEYTTSGDWYAQGVDIDGVFQRRTDLLNSTRYADVDVADTWDGFVGVQRQVAIADRPVDVEISLSGKPNLNVSESLDATGMRAPNGPRVKARNAELAENPHVPRAVEKTLSDDDWRAGGAIAYLYRRGFDVYDINRILSAGALGRAEERKLVPTRWSITAVDDTVGQYLRGRIRNAPSVDEVGVWRNDYVGNTYWVILAPGDWEFELVEMKAPGSVWSPQSGAYHVGSDYEGYTGRTAYADETSGAYYASRLGVLEELERRGRQAKVLVLRTVSNDYWAPVGVWQIRESVRNTFEGEAGVAETFHDAVGTLEAQLPISAARLRRKSELVAGVQTNLGQFGG
jgi:hypothetical protein